MEYIATTLDNLVHQTAFFNLTVGNYIMILVACVFLYLAIAKGFEPLLLLPIAFGMLLVNIYPDIMLSVEDSANGVGGLLYYFYLLDEWAIVGDSVFAGGGIGRTDLQGGDYRTLLNSIETRIFSLPDSVTLLPGHGPESTVKEEKRINPYV